MKKLLFTLMLIIVGFAALAQGNITPKEIVRENYNLRFADNNKAITDVELQQLLGEDIYGSYCSGRSLYKVGNGLKNGGWAAFGGGLGMMAVGTGLLINANETSNEVMKNGGILVVYLGMVTFINGNILIPTGYVLRGIGAGKISGIADDYNLNNKKNGYFLSFFTCHYARKCTTITRKYGVRNDVQRQFLVFDQFFVINLSVAVHRQGINEFDGRWNEVYW